MKDAWDKLPVFRKVLDMAPRQVKGAACQKHVIEADAVDLAGPDYKLSLDVVSPHVPWAKQYTKGTVKALILTDYYFQREIVELMQRFDLEIPSEYYSSKVPPVTFPP